MLLWHLSDKASKQGLVICILSVLLFFLLRTSVVSQSWKPCLVALVSLLISNLHLSISEVDKRVDYLPWSLSVTSKNERASRVKKMKSKRQRAADLERILQKETRGNTNVSVSSFKFLDEYLSSHRSTPNWNEVRDLVFDTMSRCGGESDIFFKRKTRIVLQYFIWASEQGYKLNRNTLFTTSAIEDFTRRGLPQLVESSRTNYRSELRSVARKVAAEAYTTPFIKRIPHELVRPPYSASEIQSILFTIRYQPSEERRRRLMAAVSLGLGAGINANELLELRRRDIRDYENDGIEIRVPGKNPRTVWLLNEYERDLRDGISELSPRSLVAVGKEKSGRNAVNLLYSGVFQSGSDVIKIEQVRLRNTWLIRLLEAPIPLALVMQVAGLSSARSLTDLVLYVTKNKKANQINKLMKGNNEND